MKCGVIFLENTAGLSYGREKGKRKSEKRKEFIDVKHCGLTQNEVKNNMAKYGKNTLESKKQKGFFALLWDSFNDPIIKILFISLIVNAVVSMGHINLPETLGIAAAILIATTDSAISEYSSSKAFEKLRDTTSAECTVRRDGKLLNIPVASLTVGDTVVLSAGMTVPADGILTMGKLTCNQSALTGESHDKEKKRSEKLSFCPDEEDWEPENPCQLFRGSAICRGEGEMTVLRVGENTFLGQVAGSLGENVRPSPLKHRLSDLAHSISFLGYIGAGMIAFAFLFNSFFIDSGMNMTLVMDKLSDKNFVISEVIRAVTVAVSAIVMAVPEGLPMLVTVVLSSNMKKMLRSGVLVRRLVGIETAGSMNILFTDKTGTLTTGKMTVEKVCGYGFEKTDIRQLPKAVSENIRDCIRASCGETGSATEKALKKYASGGKVPISRLPFDPDLKYSAGYNGKYSYFAGAAERLFGKSTSYISESGDIRSITPDVRKILSDKISSLAKNQYRVLCMARGENSSLSNAENLTFICFTAIRDPIRADAPSSVSEAQGAGIHVVMVTGDNIETASAIARETGIIIGNITTSLEGPELQRMTDKEIKDLLPSLAVVARALPSDKLRLVKLSQEAGLVAGMTGDGINDAPSLTAADVGFAMGGGTQIAKEAGDIVITDNSFSSITKAVLYGRTIFESIRKFIVFQLLMNFSAMGISLIGPFMGVDAPVTVIQMLWVNIIMDTLGGLAFAGEPALKKYMKRKALNRDAKILTKRMLGSIFFTGTYTLFLSIFFLKSRTVKDYFGCNDKYLLTAFFAMFIFCGIFNSFNARTESVNLLKNLSGNKPFILIMTLVAVIQLLIIYFGGEVFRCVPLSPRHLLICALIAATVIPADIIRKLIMKGKK